MSVLHKAVQTLCGLLACGNGINGELGTREDVATYEDVFFSCLIRQFVGNGIHASEELYLGVLEQIFQNDGLSNGEDNHVGIQRNQFIFVVLWIETMFGIIDRGAFLEDNAADFAIAKHFLRSPTWVDDHAIFASFFALFKRCRHDVFGLQ